MKLDVKGLRVGYGRSTVLEDLSLGFGSGVTAVIGPNGAGKSTLLNTFAGLIRQRAGELVFEGETLPPGRPDIVVRRGMSLVPEGRQVFSDLTVEDNLLVGGYRNDPRATKTDIDEVLLRFPELTRMLKTKAGSLSGGEQQMVAIARSLISRPRLMLLDEPSLGLAPLRVKEIFQGIRSLADDGMAVILVEQNVRAAVRIADEVVQLNRGKIVRRGSSADFAEVTTLEQFTDSDE